MLLGALLLVWCPRARVLAQADGPAAPAGTPANDSAHDGVHPDPPETTPPAASGTAPEARLGAARVALAAGDFARAAALAESHVLLEPGDVDGWTVLGLAAFAVGEYTRALDHFDRALGMPWPPDTGGEQAIVAFNRATCLFELERFAEAEVAFAGAGEGQSPPLSVLAAVNAGFAALEQGQLGRARDHLSRADSLDPDDSTLPAREQLAAELEAEAGGPGAGRASPRDEDDGAGDATRAAVEAYDAAVAAYGAGDERHASARFRRARGLGLDPLRDANAEAYLDAAAGGLRSVGRGWGASLALGAGYDSNASQAGLGDASAPFSLTRAADGSPVLTAGGEVGYGASLSDQSFLLAEYSIDQAGYTEADLDVFSSQDHAFELGVEHSASELLRYGLAGRAMLSIAGLRDFTPLTWSTAADIWLTLDYGDRFDTTVQGTMLASRVIDDAYAYLEGTRFEISLDQSYTRGAMRAGVGVRYRDEGLGTQHAVTVPSQELCVGCLSIYDIPLSYRGPRLAGWFALRLTDWLRAALRASAEWRAHGGASRLDVVSLSGRTGILHERTQKDRRVGVGTGLTAGLGGPFELYVGYDFTVGRSNIDNTAGEGHALDYGNLNYERHLFELELGAIF